MEAFDERLRLVELLLDPHIGNADKRAERRRYCEQHRVGERTIRGYLHRYRKKGPRGLLFYRPRPTSPRVHDPGLHAKLLALVNELPTRSVPQLRKLLATDDQLGSKINRISDRTIYRFLAEQGLTQAVRYRMLAEDSRSYCKGKVEAANKIIKNQFQREAQVAGMRTLDELNSAFWAWMDLEYNVRVHSATGQSPDARFRDGLPADHRRITDLETFNALFLWRERRTVTKYGRIKLHGNQYPVTSVPHGSVVEVRFDPYDLAQLAIYDPGGGLLETTSTSKQVTTQVPAVPEESRAKPPEVSAAARDYFTRLREQHHARLRDRNQTSFSQFRTTPKEHHDADA